MDIYVLKRKNRLISNIQNSSWTNSTTYESSDGVNWNKAPKEYYCGGSTTVGTVSLTTHNDFLYHAYVNVETDVIIYISYWHESISTPDIKGLDFIPQMEESEFSNKSHSFTLESINNHLLFMFDNKIYTFDEVKKQWVTIASFTPSINKTPGGMKKFNDKILIYSVDGTIWETSL